LREFEQEIMVHDRTEYMAGEPKWLPSNVIEISTCELRVVWRCKTGFFNYGTNLRKKT